MHFSTLGVTSFSPKKYEHYATMWLEANKEETIKNWWGWLNEENLLKMQSGYEGIYVINHQEWGDKIFLGNANLCGRNVCYSFFLSHNLVCPVLRTRRLSYFSMYANNQVTWLQLTWSETVELTFELRY